MLTFWTLSIYELCGRRRRTEKTDVAAALSPWRKRLTPQRTPLTYSANPSFPMAMLTLSGGVIFVLVIAIVSRKS